MRRSPAALVAAAGAALGVWLAASVAVAQVPAPPVLRLPDTVVPIAYDLRLDLDPGAERYTGSVDIRVRVAEPTEVTWINATGIEFLEVRAATARSGNGSLAGAIVPGNDDVVGLRFAEPLPSGEARLELRFRGSFSLTEVAGLFKQKEGGDWYVLTQMEPLFARRAFPCFDEPRFRASWRVTLTVPEGQRAFSNMPVETERALADGRREVSFRPTPPIASYLTAIAVGPWDVLDGGTAGKNATPLRYIAPRGRAAEAAYAASITPRLVELLEAYFGQPYPFAKLDSIAMPNSGHTFGAMENIGLITYDQSILLAAPDADTVRFRQGYASTAAHEIAHQWFGNLVTPEWWNDIWLNESFASWLGDKITAEAMPQWRWEYRRFGARSWAMANDRLATARRIRQPIVERSDIRSAFDGISYAKGQAVIAMFEDWLGEEKFRAGVRRYMAEHAWGVATSDDFFAALAVGDEAVLAAFRGFVDTPGVPLLAIDLDCAGGAQLALRQSRFLPVGSTGEARQRWTFPACFRVGGAGGQATQCVVVRDETARIALDGAACPRWVLGNRGGMGYFLPALSPALYAGIARGGAALDITDWLALLADTGMLVGGGVVRLPDGLTLAALGARQADPRVFGEALAIPYWVPEAVTSGAHAARYATWVRAHFGPRARATGWRPGPEDDADTRQLRRKLLPFVADHGRDDALARQARTLALRWPKDPQAVPADVRGELLYTAARTAQGDAGALFAHFAASARAASVARDRRDLLYALGAFRDPALARRAAAMVLDTTLDVHETLLILDAQLGNEATRREALAWIDRNYDALLARGGRDDFARLPEWASGGCSAGDRALLAATFAERMKAIDGGPRSYAKSLERIDLCIAYRRLQEPALARWLAAGAR